MELVVLQHFDYGTLAALLLCNLFHEASYFYSKLMNDTNNRVQPEVHLADFDWYACDLSSCYVSVYVSRFCRARPYTNYKSYVLTNLMLTLINSTYVATQVYTDNVTRLFFLHLPQKRKMSLACEIKPKFFTKTYCSLQVQMVSECSNRAYVCFTLYCRGGSYTCKFGHVISIACHCL